MSNDTARKFGYPGTLIAEVGPWLLLLRPKQPTLGSLVLVCSEDAKALGDLSANAFSTLRHAVRGCEKIGRASCRERVVSTCRSRWSTYHSKNNQPKPNTESPR